MRKGKTLLLMILCLSLTLGIEPVHATEKVESAEEQVLELGGLSLQVQHMKDKK